jgi:glutamate carboxypeptidase
VRRKAAGTLRVTGRGVAAHSGSAPERGANALLALAQAAQVVASRNDPHGEHALTSVPTVLRSGDSFNRRPRRRELLCDLRAHDHTVFDTVREAVPTAVDGATLEAELIRVWPGMDSGGDGARDRRRGAGARAR